MDASALVDVILDQPTAPWVFDRIAGEEIHCPAHQPAEVLSALARLARVGEIGTDAAQDALAEAAALPQHPAMPTPAQLDRAFALRDRVRVLDGLYVALAEQCGCALVTTDRRLAGARLPCEVHAPLS